MSRESSGRSRVGRRISRRSISLLHAAAVVDRGEYSGSGRRPCNGSASRAEAGRPSTAAPCVRRACRRSSESRQRGPIYRVLRLMTSVTMLDVTLLGGMRSGPFFALLVKRNIKPSENSVFGDRSDRARASRRIRARDVGGRRAERSRARGPRARVAWHGRPISTERSGLVADVTAAWRSPAAAVSRPRRDSPGPRAASPISSSSGTTISAAKASLLPGDLGAVAVLEVNAPVIDHPGSVKQWIDRMMIVQPLRRWREWQCSAADLIVTPSARILPAHVPAAARARNRVGRRHRSLSPGSDWQGSVRSNRRRHRC